jgi:hypothetical protein
LAFGPIDQDSSFAYASPMRLTLAEISSPLARQHWLICDKRYLRILRDHAQSLLNSAPL